MGRHRIVGYICVCVRVSPYGAAPDAELPSPSRYGECWCQGEREKKKKERESQGGKDKNMTMWERVRAELEYCTWGYGRSMALQITP